MKINYSRFAGILLGSGKGLQISVNGGSLSSVLRSGARNSKTKIICIILCLSFLLNASLSLAEGPDIQEYLIAVGDLLEVRIWRGFEEKKYDAAVKADGTITVGFADAKVGDMTVRQAEAELKKALLAYIKEPKVEITVKEYKGRTASLIGAVQTPAKQYALKGKTTLSQLIIMAGGFTKDADLENVQVTKPDGMVKKANLYQIMFAGDVSKDIIVESGDMVSVPYKVEVEEKNIFIFGEARNPGVYKLTQGLTLVQALGKAGGYKEEAVIDEIKIIRGGLEKPQIIAADVKAIFEEGDITKDSYLQKNDIIYIPRSKIANWNAFLGKIRPTLEFLIMPFAGTRVIEDVIKGRQ